MFGNKTGTGLFSGPGKTGAAPMGPRQLTLTPSQGFSGNGIATIGMDNTFSVLAHLPAPHTLSPHSPAVYAAYLVDAKGKNGFFAGTLKPAGNGMFQVNFRSPVPLVHYNRVVVSLENPQGIMQAPQGPVIMKVKEGMFDSLGPVKKVGGDMWGKVKGFVGNLFGKKPEDVEQAPVQTAPMQQAPPAQYYQQYAPQQPPQYAPQQPQYAPQQPQQYVPQQPQQYAPQQPQQYVPQQPQQYAPQQSNNSLGRNPYYQGVNHRFQQSYGQQTPQAPAAPPPPAPAPSVPVNPPVQPAEGSSETIVE